MIKKGLGKGLEALITSASTDSGELEIKELKINEIEPNTDQPRKNFDQEKLQQLSDSIKVHGIIQPIVVRKENGTYKIIAGERRWRAARLAGMTVVPVVIKEVTNEELMEMALIENLQREDLNAIEEAHAYNKLINEYKLTQEQIADKVGKSRPAVANSLRLLNLSEEVKQLVIKDKLSGGHARALIAIADEKKQLEAAVRIVEKELSVRETEKLVKSISEQKTEKQAQPEKKDMTEIYSEIEDKLKNIFGTKVILAAKKNKGKITIEYYSNEELDRILEIVESLSASETVSRETTE